MACKVEMLDQAQTIILMEDRMVWKILLHRKNLNQGINTRNLNQCIYHTTNLEQLILIGRAYNQAYRMVQIEINIILFIVTYMAEVVISE